MGNKWFRDGPETLNPPDNPYLHVRLLDDGDYVYRPSATPRVKLRTENRTIQDYQVWFGLRTKSVTSWSPAINFQDIDIISQPEGVPTPVDLDEAVGKVAETIQANVLLALNTQPDSIVIECGRLWSNRIEAIVSETIAAHTGQSITSKAEGRMHRIHQYRWTLNSQV